MADDFLSRWSRRKGQARRGIAPEEPSQEPPLARVPAAAAAAPVEEVAAKPELPPVESLTPESDFAPFMDRDVAPEVRSDALRKLFQDPRCNVMDGLDVYVDDYSKPDPLPDGWLARMNQVKRLGDYIDPELPAEGAVAEGEPTVQGAALAEPVDGGPDEPGAGDGTALSVDPDQTPEPAERPLANKGDSPSESDTSV